MLTELHWIDGPWQGKLALAARPRGGDWLEDELAGWRSAGVRVVVSLLMTDESEDLGLAEEGAASGRVGLRFRSFPIVDRDVPQSRLEFGREIEGIAGELAAGNSVLIHCRQGVGRAGLMASALLVSEGLGWEAAVRRVSAGRGLAVPETDEQRRWLENYASAVVPPTR